MKTWQWTSLLHSKKYGRIVGLLICAFIFTNMLFMYKTKTCNEKPSLLDGRQTLNVVLKKTYKNVQPFFTNEQSTNAGLEEINNSWFSFWRLQPTTFCDNNFVGYANEFARLKNVFLWPKLAHGRPGGEPIDFVLNQSESSEYTTLDNGFFQMHCSNPMVDGKIKYSYKDNLKNHLTKYQNSLKTLLLTEHVEEDSRPSMLANYTVFIITRYEYVNLYHSLTTFFNAYLTMKFFKLQPTDVAILLIDGHPAGGLDSIWKALFSGVVERVGHLESRNAIQLRDAVFVMQSYHCPLNQNLVKVPLLEEFRNFFLEGHGLASKSSGSRDCKKLRVLFIWRRDYVAHPRNPSGSISRKIFNEEELIDIARHVLPDGAIVQGVQIDKLSVVDQLRFVSETDILIGMHGAGLAHVMFLPKHAAMIELFPIYWSSGNVHFKMIAKWRNLIYQQWINRDRSNEVAKHYTKVPIFAMRFLLQQVLKRFQCT